MLQGPLPQSAAAAGWPTGGHTHTFNIYCGGLPWIPNTTQLPLTYDNIPSLTSRSGRVGAQKVSELILILCSSLVLRLSACHVACIIISTPSPALGVAPTQLLTPFKAQVL